MLVVESRRRKLATIEKRWPGATIIDVTSKGGEPWVRFSPFYPHGGIPIPNSPGQFAQSVEGLWQGLKVFEHEDIDSRRWAVTNMSGIKRSRKSRGAVLGHRFGIGSKILLGYREARYAIYLPAYKWVLDNRLGPQVEELRRQSSERSVILLDYETNGSIDNLAHPLSHATLIRSYIEGTWPLDH